MNPELIHNGQVHIFHVHSVLLIHHTYKMDELVFFLVFINRPLLYFYTTF